jgi:hypothetical protein
MQSALQRRTHQKMRGEGEEIFMDHDARLEDEREKSRKMSSQPLDSGSMPPNDLGDFFPSHIARSSARLLTRPGNTFLPGPYLNASMRLQASAYCPALIRSIRLGGFPGFAFLQNVPTPPF